MNEIKSFDLYEFYGDYKTKKYWVIDQKSKQKLFPISGIKNVVKHVWFFSIGRFGGFQSDFYLVKLSKRNIADQLNHLIKTSEKAQRSIIKMITMHGEDYGSI